MDDAELIRLAIDEDTFTPQSPRVLASEVKRLKKLETLVKSILLQKGDDHCWRDWRGNYEQMARLCGVEFKPEMLDKPQMMANCSHFIDCLMSGEHYVTPDPAAELRSELAQVRGVIRRARDEIAMLPLWLTEEGEKS